MTEQCPVSVIILTYNEEVNIAHCLKSALLLSNEVFVVDSYSTDQTLEIARRFTDKIYQNPWIHWAVQRNWALDNLPLPHEWVLFLDADERLSKELCQEIKDALKHSDQGVEGYYIKRNFYFLGKWLKYGGYRKDFILRLVKKDKARSVGSGAREYVTLKGGLGRLKYPMIHDDHKDLGFWIDKHNRLAKLEAEELLRMTDKQGQSGVTINSDTKKIEHSFRIWLREKIWIRMPIFIRPFFYFIYRYFFQLGILDGKVGFVYCFLHALWYNLLVDAKYYEITQTKTFKRDPYKVE
ncbi:MAG: glycosyltransferase family 2 protein [Thermodesulfobacteriota bacterium]